MLTMTWNTNKEGRLSARWVESNTLLKGDDFHNGRRSCRQRWLVRGRQMVRPRLAPVSGRPRMTLF